MEMYAHGQGCVEVYALFDHEPTDADSVLKQPYPETEGETCLMLKQNFYPMLSNCVDNVSVI